LVVVVTGVDNLCVIYTSIETYITNPKQCNQKRNNLMNCLKVLGVY